VVQDSCFEHGDTSIGLLLLLLLRWLDGDEPVRSDQLVDLGRVAAGVARSKVPRVVRRTMMLAESAAMACSGQGGGLWCSGSQIGLALKVTPHSNSVPSAGGARCQGGAAVAQVDMLVVVLSLVVSAAGRVVTRPQPFAPTLATSHTSL